MKLLIKKGINPGWNPNYKKDNQIDQRESEILRGELQSKEFGTLPQNRKIRFRAAKSIHRLLSETVKVFKGEGIDTSEIEKGIIRLEELKEDILELEGQELDKPNPNPDFTEGTKKSANTPKDLSK